jgi:hypothetical protein
MGTSTSGYFRGIGGVMSATKTGLTDIAVKPLTPTRFGSRSALCVREGVIGSSRGVVVIPR